MIDNDLRGGGRFGVEGVYGKTLLAFQVGAFVLFL